MLMHEQVGRNPSQFVLNLLKGSEMLQELSDQFAPLLSRFRIFNFWEAVPTGFRKTATCVVEESSAAPLWDDVERCGISATHSAMVKFKTQLDSGFRVITDALLRYIRLAPELITIRWEQDTRYLASEHQREAELLTTGPSSYLSSENADPSGCNKWCLGPRSPSMHFTGRHFQSKYVQDKLGPVQVTPSMNQHKIFVIFGLGGSGKTQFSLKYIEENKACYPGILWLDASSEENIESGYASLGQEMNKGASFAAGIHWLSRCSLPWLLVLDNADDPDLDFSKYIPSGNKGHILITTRNPSLQKMATAGYLRFRGMDPEEAVSLLLRTASADIEPLSANPQNRSLAQGIASELGYLALALAQAGAAIRRRIYTLERYLHYYLGDRKRMLSCSRARSADEANIITTWEVPFTRIQAKDLVECKDAVGLIHILAFMHFEAVPERIFQRSWNRVSSPVPKEKPYLGIFRRNTGWNEETSARLRRAISVLFDYSLIDHEPDKALVSLHPVVQTWARDRLSGEEQSVWLCRASSILASCISAHLEVSEHAFRRSLMPHIESCLVALRLRFRSLPDSLERATEMEKFASVYAENGLWRQARGLQREVADYRARRLGWRHEDTLRARSSLAYTLWNLFDVRPSIETHFQVLKSRWWLRPSWQLWLAWPPWIPDHVDYCMTLSDLTLTLWLARQLKWSKYTGERAVRGLTKHLGSNDPMTLTAKFNLARTYLHLGESAECQHLLLEVIRKRKHFFGNEHPDTLMARNELGMCLCAQKRNLATAERLVRNVLESRRKLLGDEHAYTLWSENDLSKVLCTRKRPEEAASILEDILPVVQRTLGEDHVGISMTKWNLARAYCNLERWQEAEEVMAAMLATMADDHPNWVDITSGYVFVLIHLRRLDEAERRCKAMLDMIPDEGAREPWLLDRILRRTALTPEVHVLQRDSPRTVAIAQQLLVIYTQRERFDDIAELKRKVSALDLQDSEERFEMLPIKRAMAEM